MIVYLGMPKCASSWIWENIKKDFPYDGVKEPHALVELGIPDNSIVDFSTNNWSMDSSTVRLIDKQVNKYIYVVRDPMEIANSYFAQTSTGKEKFNDFVFSLVKTKLLCFGDIIERWYNLVDKEKILIYDYNRDIVGKQEQFIKDLCARIGMNSRNKNWFLGKQINQTIGKTNYRCDDKLMTQLRYQMDKFYRITGILPYLSS